MLPYRPALSQPIADKADAEKARDIAVVVATAAGAALSVLSIDRQKGAMTNGILALSAVALAAIGITTLVHDIL